MGDITRSSFLAANHYSSVRQQQGRLWLDAEWNEQADIEAHRIRVGMLDVIGADGAPADAPGFQLAAATMLNAVAVSGGSVIVAGEDARILEGSVSDSPTLTTSGWTQAATPSGVTASLNAAASAGTKTWLVGDSATILLIEGGGPTAQSAPSGVSANLHGVAAIDPSHAFAVGDHATVMATTDGSSWVAQTAPAGLTGALHAVYFTSETTGWAVGDAGQIIATTDGGTTWQAQAAKGVTADLFGVWFADAQHGCVVGAGAMLLTTGDGGQTWTQQPPPDGVTADLAGVSGHSTTELWAVGEEGTIVFSQDGGSTWRLYEVPSGPQPDLAAVAAVASGMALAVGDLSAVWALAVSATAPAPQSGLPTGGSELSVSAGRMYVDGILVENERTVRLSAQPDLPGSQAETAPGTYLAYLDVWHRELTAVEEPQLREVALGGPDTTTRLKTVWQAKLESVSANSTCASFGPGWTPDTAVHGRMSARAIPALVPPNDCMVPAGGGYQSLENQLYRVEVHTGGTLENATFKWSRDNASMLSTLQNIDDATSQVIVGSAGPDDVLGFASAAYVELSDDRRVLSGQSGDLLQVQSVLQTAITWQNWTGTPPQMSDFGAGATVRRWDGELTKLSADTWVTLESGVQIQFTEGEYAVGDYWLIPARTLTASIEWPSNGGGLPSFEPPAGIEHHYCPLGLVTLAAETGWSVASDCRAVFPPLTEMTRFFYVGGDGQEQDATNGQPLPEPLEVGVMNGTRPVVGASVQFTIIGGSGQLAPVGGSMGAGPIVVSTGANGIAACNWTLSTTPTAQRVEAKLLGPGDTATEHVPLHFNAQVIADTGKSVCTVTAMPGDDLQAAADSLISLGGGELCLAAGSYPATSPVIFDASSATHPVSITVTGRGPATQVTCNSDPVVLHFEQCADVTVRSLSVIAGAAPKVEPTPAPAEPAPPPAEPAPAEPAPAEPAPVAPGPAPTGPTPEPAPVPIRPIVTPGALGALSAVRATGAVRPAIALDTTALSTAAAAGGGGTAALAGLTGVARTNALQQTIISTVTNLHQFTSGSSLLQNVFPPRAAIGEIVTTFLPSLPGAIQASGCVSVKVLDCVVSCPDGATTVQAGLAAVPVLSTDRLVAPGEVYVERTRFVTGSNQVGIFIRGAAAATVAHNHVLLQPAIDLIPFSDNLGAVTDEVASQMNAAIQPQSASTTQVQVGNQTINIDSSSPAAPMWREFVKSPQAQSVTQGADVATELHNFVTGIASSGVTGSLGDAVNGILVRFRFVARGIVILGSSSVEVEGNVVDDAAMGIYVMGQNNADASAEQAGHVTLRHNFINLEVPRTTSDNAGAVYVESAGRANVVGTMATATRLWRGKIVTDLAPVSGIIVNGTQGPLLVVRETSTDGFHIGVEIESTLPTPAVWLAAETMATNTGGGEAVSAPQGVVEQNNAST